MAATPRLRSFGVAAAALCLPFLQGCGDASPSPAASEAAVHAAVVDHADAPPVSPSGAAAAPASAAPPSRPSPGEWPRSAMGLPQMEIEIKGERFLLEMALDEGNRQIGLSRRAALPPGKGMIFVHPRPEVLRYWMWECLIDLDMIYLDREGRVTATHRMKKEPPRRPNESVTAYTQRLRRYSSVRPAVFAIELPAGSLDRLDLREGEVIGFDHEGLRRLATP
jgi:uncharacterized membrane protein (UPF0127 family)